MSLRRWIGYSVASAALALGLTACVSPKAGDERRVTVQGTFVGGTGAATTDGGLGISGRLSFTPQAPQAR